MKNEEFATAMTKVVQLEETFHRGSKFFILHSSFFI